MKNKPRQGFSINSLFDNADDTISIEEITEIDEQRTKTLALGSEPTPKDALKQELSPRPNDNTKAIAYIINIEDGNIFPVCNDSSTIGCAASCDITLEQYAQDHTISRNHAKLIHVEGRFFLTDTSSNGTYTAESAGDTLKFNRLSKGVATEVKNGQIIRFANKLFKFIVE